MNKRILKSKRINTDTQVKILGGIFVGVFLVFGVYGVGKNIGNVKEKQEMASELKGDLAVIKENIFKIESAQEELKNYSKQLAALNSHIPDEPNIDSYLKSLVEAVASSGFIVESIRTKPDSESPQGMTVEINTIGTSKDIKSSEVLTKNIEDIDRITYVKSVTVSKGKDDEVVVKMVLKIFHLTPDQQNSTQEAL